MTWNLTWWRFLFHIQNWWDSGHLLIYLLFAPVRSSETRQIDYFQSVSSERMGWLTYNLTFGNNLTNSQTGLIGITISWNLLILVRLWLSETVQIWGFWIFSWEHLGGMAKIQHDDVSWRYLELIRFWSWSVDFHIFLLMTALWFHANLTGLFWLRDVTAIIFLDLLVRLFVMIYEVMKKANFSICKLSLAIV